MSEFPEALLNNVARRRKHHGTGLSTPIYQPYRAFGDMKHTDPFQWVADYFGVSAPTPSLLYQVGRYGCAAIMLCVCVG